MSTHLLRSGSSDSSKMCIRDSTEDRVRDTGQDQHFLGREAVGDPAAGDRADDGCDNVSAQRDADLRIGKAGRRDDCIIEDVLDIRQQVHRGVQEGACENANHTFPLLHGVNPLFQIKLIIPGRPRRGNLLSHTVANVMDGVKVAVDIVHGIFHGVLAHQICLLYTSKKHTSVIV